MRQYVANENVLSKCLKLSRQTAVSGNEFHIDGWPQRKIISRTCSAIVVQPVDSAGGSQIIVILIITDFIAITVKPL